MKTIKKYTVTAYEASHLGPFGPDGQFSHLSYPLDGRHYDTGRGKALFEAIGADQDDPSYSLMSDPTGSRWAIMGENVEGHQYAVESE